MCTAVAALSISRIEVKTPRKDQFFMVENFMLRKHFLPPVLTAAMLML